MVCLDMSPTENVGDVLVNSQNIRDIKLTNMEHNTSKKASAYYGSNQETEILTKSDPP